MKCSVLVYCSVQQCTVCCNVDTGKRAKESLLCPIELCVQQGRGRERRGEMGRTISQFFYSH